MKSRGVSCLEQRAFLSINCFLNQQRSLTHGPCIKLLLLSLAWAMPLRPLSDRFFLNLHPRHSNGRLAQLTAPWGSLIVGNIICIQATKMRRLLPQISCLGVVNFICVQDTEAFAPTAPNTVTWQAAGELPSSIKPGIPTSRSRSLAKIQLRSLATPSQPTFPR